jgi:hypothetical protein
MVLNYRMEFQSTDRLNGSGYAEPVYQNVNIPQPIDNKTYSFLKISISSAIINADIATGGDPSYVTVSFKGKYPLNQIRATGNGSNVSHRIAHVPFKFKEIGQANLYYLDDTTNDNYALYPITSFQDNEISLELRDGTGNLIVEPQQGEYINYTIVVNITPMNHEDF